MKTTSWLILSGGLNVVLLCAAVSLGLRAKSARHGTELAPRPGGGGTVEVRALTAAATPRPVTNLVEVNEPFNWAQVEAADYEAYAANLRRIGCPEATLRDIITADVDALFRGRVREFVARYQDSFWALMSTPDQVHDFIEKRGEDVEQLGTERDKLLKTILGDSAPDQSRSRPEATDLENAEKRKLTLDFLPAEKASACIAIERKYEELCNRVRSSTNKAGLKLLEQQRDGELQGLMSAEEYAEYRLRASPSANIVAGLGGFAASENEMREIARIQEKFRTIQRTSENQGRQKAELTALLGEQRAEDFDLALKSDYRDICLVAHRYKLPPQTARDVYAVRTAALEQATRVQADASLSREQKLALLGAVRAEAERSLVAALGEDAFDAYSSRFSGNWLSQLEHVKR